MYMKNWRSCHFPNHPPRRCCCGSVAAKALPKATSLNLRSSATKSEQPLILSGKGASQQLVLTGKLANGSLRDYTRHASYLVEPATVARVDEERICPSPRRW